MHLTTVNCFMALVVLCSKLTKCYLASAMSPFGLTSFPFKTDNLPIGLSSLHDRIENLNVQRSASLGQKSLQKAQPYISTRQLVETANRAALASNGNSDGRTVLGEIETIGKIIEVIQSVAGIVLPIVVDKASKNRDFMTILTKNPREISEDKRPFLSTDFEI